jgi:hypothetical protein
VKGITVWSYTTGQTCNDGKGFVSPGGNERQAMK